MPEHPDLIRLRKEYADRELRLAGSDIYSPFNTANQFTLQQRQWDTLQLLKKAGTSSLSKLRLLEIGCGEGGGLQEYLALGADPCKLHGIDLLPHRLTGAHARFPHLPLACADGQCLPYSDNTFDLVFQYTAFSSILDMDIKKRIAHEMMRVLQPKGLVLWYDFWLNPRNRQTRGISPAEIRQLFPGCVYLFRRVTLAPPLSRGLVSLSKILAVTLEKLAVFNTHYLVAIQSRER